MSGAGQPLEPVRAFEPMFIEMSERVSENWYELSGSVDDTAYDVEVDADTQRILIRENGAG